MKAAMWGVMISVMGITGIVLINIFGNITTTNQQDYTLLKNTTSAAMYDSIDLAAYRTGFYVCSTETEFTDSTQYDISYVDVSNEDYKCNYLVGEVKLKSEVFIESFFRRYSENMQNNKSYKVTIKEVIEYPPKVSIKIDTYNTYNSTDSTTLEFNEGDFAISNQVDAIFETGSDWGDIPEIIPDVDIEKEYDILYEISYGVSSLDGPVQDNNNLKLYTDTCDEESCKMPTVNVKSGYKTENIKFFCQDENGSKYDENGNLRIYQYNSGSSISNDNAYCEVRSVVYFLCSCDATRNFTDNCGSLVNDENILTVTPYGTVQYVCDLGEERDISPVVSVKRPGAVRKDYPKNPIVKTFSGKNNNWFKVSGTTIIRTYPADEEDGHDKDHKFAKFDLYYGSINKCGEYNSGDWYFKVSKGNVCTN